MWWAEITKTIKLRLEKRKNIFFPAFYPDLPYLPFSINKIFHVIEKCSIVKTISVITCWSSLPELFVIFSCLGLRLFKALVNVKKKHREHLDSVLSTPPNQTVVSSFSLCSDDRTNININVCIYIYIYIYIWIELGKKQRDYDTYIYSVIWIELGKQ